MLKKLKVYIIIIIKYYYYINICIDYDLEELRSHEKYDLLSYIWAMVPESKHFTVSTVLSDTNPNEEQFKQMCEHGGYVLISTLAVTANGELRDKCIRQLGEAKNSDIYLHNLVESKKYQLIIQLWKTGSQVIRSKARQVLLSIEFDSIYFMYLYIL